MLPIEINEFLCQYAQHTVKYIFSVGFSIFFVGLCIHDRIIIIFLSVEDILTENFQFPVVLAKASRLFMGWPGNYYSSPSLEHVFNFFSLLGWELRHVDSCAMATYAHWRSSVQQDKRLVWVGSN